MNTKEHRKRPSPPSIDDWWPDASQSEARSHREAIRRYLKIALRVYEQEYIRKGVLFADVDSSKTVCDDQLKVES